MIEVPSQLWPKSTPVSERGHRPFLALYMLFFYLIYSCSPLPMTNVLRRVACARNGGESTAAVPDRTWEVKMVHVNLGITLLSS